MEAKSKLVIIISSFTGLTDDGEPIIRNLPELDKYFEQGFIVKDIVPIVPNQSGGTSAIRAIQVVVHLIKQF